MLKNPVVLAGVLAGTVALLLRARGSPRFGIFFRWVPLPFYAYFLPALLTAFGLLPARHALYDTAGAVVLPPCLALLILNADLAALRF